MDMLCNLSPLGKKAMEYANAGGAVFPCEPKGKKPLTPHGLKDATTNAEQIRRWWTETTDANIGIPTGSQNGLIVFDVDGPEGEASLAALESKYGPLPKTLASKTARGRHLYFRHPGGSEIKNSAGKLGAKLDVRGDGGYVISPPSVHETGAVYEWI
jgi:hypothetical protein